MAQLNPYLNFSNNCREAMNFYKDCLGGELTMQTVGEMPAMAAQMPPEYKDSIVHSTLNSGGMVIMGSDMVRGTRVEGNTVHLCINCTSAEELNNLFAKLAVGGTITDPVADMPWGGLYGSLTDKYSKQWVFNFQKG